MIKLEIDVKIPDMLEGEIIPFIINNLLTKSPAIKVISIFVAREFN